MIWKLPVFSQKDFGQVPQRGVMFDPSDQRSYVLGIKSNAPEACFHKSVKTGDILLGLASYGFAFLLLLLSYCKDKVKFVFKNRIKFRNLRI